MCSAPECWADAVATASTASDVAEFGNSLNFVAIVDEANLTLSFRVFLATLSGLKFYNHEDHLVIVGEKTKNMFYYFSKW